MIVYRKVSLVDPAPLRYLFLTCILVTRISFFERISVTKMKLLLSLTLVLAAAQADVTIDLAKAVFDEDLGQFCVMQKVLHIIV